MAQEIFKRTEKKYLLDRDKYNLLIARLEAYTVRDAYFESDIISLYYDTPDYRLIRASIEKPAFKEKIRLRSYGVPDLSDKVFLEIKRKYKGVVYKRRFGASLGKALKFANGVDPDAENPQIADELKWAFSYYPQLSPRMLISCRRYSYRGKDDPELRITFDSRILFRNYDLRPDKGIYGRPLLNDGERLMEIKTPGAMPLWLSHLLDELKIYPTSFSKYGTAYLTLLSENALGENRTFHGVTA